MKNLEDKGLEFSYELVVTSYENWTRDRSADGQRTKDRVYIGCCSNS